MKSFRGVGEQRCYANMFCPVSIKLHTAGDRSTYAGQEIKEFISLHNSPDVKRVSELADLETQ